MSEGRPPAEFVAPPRRMGVLSILRARKLLAGAVFLAVFLPGLLLTWDRGRPGYVATAQIQVAPQFPKLLEADPEVEQQARNYTAFLLQQAADLTRPEVLEAALEAMGEWRWLWQDPEESLDLAVDRLSNALEIDTKQGSFTILVSLEGSHPDGLAETVNAVVSTYLAKQSALYDSETRVVSLRELRVREEKEVEQLLEQKSRLAKELGVSSFASDASNPYQLSLIETSNALHAARRELLAAESELAAREAHRDERLALEAESEARLLLNYDAAGTQTADALQTRRDELVALLARLRPEHPSSATLREELEGLEAARRGVEETAVARTQETLRQRRATEAGLALVEARQAAEHLRSYAASLEDEFERLKERVSWFVTRFAAGVETEQAIARRHATISAIEARVNFLEIESGAPGFSREHSRARRPLLPSRGGHLKYVLAILVLAAGASLGATVLVDNLDQRLYTPYDIERTFGYPPIGWLVERSGPAAAEFAAEQLRRLALSLERERAHAGTRSFVVTAVRPGTPTSALVGDLAEELSRLGGRVLVVEANRESGGSPAGTRGLVDVLRGSLTAAAAIVPGSPARLPLGTLDDQRHLPNVQHVGDLFRALADDWDLVLVDAPPVLVSSDAELLVGTADATLLVVSARSDAVGEVRRAVATLERLAPPSVGFLLTRVRGPLDWSQYRAMMRAHDRPARPASVGAPG